LQLLLRPEVIDGNGIGNIHKPTLCPINHLRKYPENTDKLPTSSSSSSSSSGVTQLDGNASLKGKNRRFFGGQSFSGEASGSSKSGDLVTNPDVLLPTDMSANQSMLSNTGSGISRNTPSLPGGDFVSLRVEQVPPSSSVQLPSPSLMDSGIDMDETVPSPPVFSRQDTFGGCKP